MAPKRKVPSTTSGVSRKMKAKTTVPASRIASVGKKVNAKTNDALDSCKDEAMTNAVAYDSTTVTNADKNITGLNLFRKDYYGKHMHKSGKKHLVQSQKEAVIAWRQLTDGERETYNAKANERRAAYRKTHGLSNTKTPAFQTRCSPRRFQDRIAKLKEVQVATVKEMGFDSLFDLDCYVLNRVLCLELVKSFNLQDHTLCIKSSRIPVTYEDVGRVLGIPVSGMEVKSVATDDDLGELDEFYGITVAELETIMATESSTVRFKRAFLLYALSIFLCPTSKNAPSTKLLPAIIDIHNVKGYNWSKFVFDWLVREITRYKKASLSTLKPKDKKSIGGCMFFLMVVYFYKRPLGCEPISNERPLLKTWNTLCVQHRIKEEKRNEQGLLYHLDNVDNYTAWLHDTLKSEISRYWHRQIMEFILKPFDAAVMAGRFELRSFSIPTTSNSDEDEIHGDFSEDVEENDGDLEMTSDEDDKEVGLQSKKVRPTRQVKKGPSMRSPFVSGQNSKKATSKLHQTVYNYCTTKPSNRKDGNEVLVKMFDQYLTREDAYTLRPKGWVNTMVFLLAPKVLMEDEKERSQIVTRHMFSHLFIERVKRDLEMFKVCQHKPWSNKIAVTFISPAKVGYDISQCKLIFAPALYENHWFYYVLDPKQKKLFVLDSLGKHEEGSEKAVLDDLVKLRFEEVLHILNPTLSKKSIFIDLIHVDLPQQQNCDDCGVYVLKYMDTWDGVTRWGDKTMPEYSLEEVSMIRQNLLCGWVLHSKNEVKEKVLGDLKVTGL